MNAVNTCYFESQPPDQTVSDTPPEVIETVEEPRWEPRRVHVPRALVWGILILFGLAILVMGAWGLSHSTWTYGMTPVDSATTARLVQIQRNLLAAGVPESSLRHLAVAAQPSVNVGDAIEALVDADKDLEAWSANPAVASARAELRETYYSLSGRRYGGSGSPFASVTPFPTLAIPTPNSP